MAHINSVVDPAKESDLPVLAPKSFKFYISSFLKYDMHRKYSHSDKDTHGSLLHYISLYSNFCL